MIPFDSTASYSDAIFDLIFDKLVYLKQVVPMNQDWPIHGK